MGHCRYDMEIRYPLDQLRGPGANPFLRFRPLAAGAAPVPTGCVMEELVSTFRADADRIAEHSGLAPHDTLRSPFLVGSHRMVFSVERIPLLENITDRISRHGSILHVKGAFQAVFTADAQGCVDGCRFDGPVSHGISDGKKICS